MSHEPNKPDRTLSEISHLFLSSVRDRRERLTAQSNRKPPGLPCDSAELTAEELAHVNPGSSDNACGLTVRGAPVTAVLAAHLGTQQGKRVREYVSHLCGIGERIGLIELDVTDFRLFCFERGSTKAAINPPTSGPYDSLESRRITEALQELGCEINRWLILVSAPRAGEARALLRELDNWVLLTSCDHDGIIAAYRALKGVADLHRSDGAEKPPRPKLSLALLDAQDEIESMQVFRKLSGVCQQFLDWPLESEPAVKARKDVVEHEVLVCRATRDKGTLGATPHWQAVLNFVRQIKSAPAEVAPAAPKLSRPVAAPKGCETETASMLQGTVATAASDSEVLDLPAGDASPGAISAAFLRGGSGLIECPVRPPLCSDATVAVARDRRLVLLAAPGKGLQNLAEIANSYRWLIENRSLIAMALPQFAIDADEMPRLQLLVDHADLSAQLLQPILQSPNLTIHAYRKLRWAGKTGLLLEAA